MTELKVFIVYVVFYLKWNKKIIYSWIHGLIIEPINDQNIWKMKQIDNKYDQK